MSNDNQTANYNPSFLRIRPGFVRHNWPEKAGKNIFRPNGIEEFLFLHFWNSFEIELNGQIIKTAPHACIILKKGTPQNYRWDEPATQDWFRVVGDVETVLNNYNIKTDTIYYPKNYSFITSLTRKIELECTIADTYSLEICNNYLNNLFILLSREISSVNQVVASSLNIQTKEQLRKLRFEFSMNYSKKWTVQDMADFINVSPSYLHATYKSYYGVSPIQDLINVRMQQAAILLSDPDKTVTEISVLLGYPTSQQFIRQFKKNMGVSPLTYRNDMNV